MSRKKSRMSITHEDLKVLMKALAFAAAKHKDQCRKDANASPYINHPISLVNILCNEGHVSDIDVICGALLHDTVEDTDATAEEMEAEFGKRIRDLVMEVTDDKSLPKPERKRLQVEHAPHLSDQAKLVKLADKISNLRDIEMCPPVDWDLQRRRQYYDWAKNVVDGLRGVHPALEELFDTAYSKRPG